MLVLVAILLSPVLIGVALYRFGSDIYFKFRFRKKWGAQNKCVLFVTSDSPNWKDYIEQTLLPTIAEHAVTLNWSERHSWKQNQPLEAQIMRRYAGDREYCPVAIVVPPRGKVITVRFYQAFKEHKHGKARLLQSKMSELQALIAQHAA